jgi:molybdopterin-guanine dinucleotide biosynthesis protein A
VKAIDAKRRRMRKDLVMRSVIVLAGGVAERFQVSKGLWYDKALTKLNGTTFLEKVVKTASEVADDVVVCANTRERGEKYKKLLESKGFKFNICVDETGLPIKGPIVGLKTGMRCCQGTSVLVIPVDHPFIKTGVLELMFKFGVGWHTVTPLWPNGKIEPLIAYYDKEHVFGVIQAICMLSKGRIGDVSRGSSKMLFVSVKEFEEVDPNLESFVNINCPNDLEIRPTNMINGDSYGSISIEIEKFDSDFIKLVLDEAHAANAENAFRLINRMNHKFWKANLLKRLADKTGNPELYFKSGEEFLFESRQYMRKKISFHELHALIDADEMFKKAGRFLDLRNRIDVLFRQLELSKRRK